MLSVRLLEKCSNYIYSAFATFVSNFYSKSFKLFTIGVSRLKSTEGIIQGDPMLFHLF